MNNHATRLTVLNAPEHLFVSHTMARQFSDLVESVIVLSYNTHLPGPAARKWNGDNDDDGDTQSPLGLATRCLKGTATAPFLIQRSLLRFLQPLLQSGFLLLWLAMLHSWLAAGLVIAVGAVALAAAAARYVVEARVVDAGNNDLTRVHPVVFA